MSRLKSFRMGIILAAATGFTALADSGFACAVCFGDPASPLVQGAKNGVIFLALVIYGVLFSMAGIVYYWYRRAKALELAEARVQDGEASTSAGEMPGALPSEG